LAFLVDAQYDGLLGRIVVEADNVDDLVSLYRLIMVTACAQHAVGGPVPGMLDASVGYMSHDIGERVSCRGA
jgi:hypothetical protein